MSLNFKEVAATAEAISNEIQGKNLRVRNVELVEQKLPATFTDLCVAIFFEDYPKVLLFCLKAPWVGIFFSEYSSLRPVARKGTNPDDVWKKRFKGTPSWKSAINDSTLEKIECVENDRIVHLSFSNKTHITVELFSARPNWIVKSGEITSSWREHRKEKKKAPQESSILDKFSKRSFGQSPGDSWLEQSFNHYRKQKEEAFVDFYYQKLLSEVLSRLNQKLKIKRQLEKSLKKSGQAQDVKAKGEQLKGLLYKYPKTFRGEEVEGIKLDSKLSLSENANRYFDKYKKLNRTKSETESRLKVLEEQIKKKNLILADVRKLNLSEDSTKGAFHKIDEIAKHTGLVLDDHARTDKSQKDKTGTKKSERKWKKTTIRKFLSKEGLEIFIGRNHKENEELVVRLAKGNDIWMHLKSLPGAHGIVRVPKGRSASLETLLDAATLVAHYSSVKPNQKVDVDYTFKKNVKRLKSKGGKKVKTGQFLVNYTQNKTLTVGIESDRLNRVFETEE